MVTAVLSALFLCVSCNQYDEEYTPDYTIATNTFEADRPAGVWDLMKPVSVLTGEGLGYDGSQSCVAVSDRTVSFEFDADEHGNVAYVYDAAYLCCLSDKALVSLVGTYLNNEGVEMTRSLTLDLTHEVNAESGAPVWVRANFSLLSYDVSSKSYFPLKSLTVSAVNPSQDGSLPLVYIDNISVRLP